MINRRQLLRWVAASTIGSLAGSRTLFADADTDKRFVLVFLRGGLDSLHALAPYADRDYQLLRPALALGGRHSDRPSLDLDGYFGLHPALAPLHALYLQRELLLIPAAATRYRQRSHFDGQNMLENGSGKPYGANDGWLNRAITAMNDNDRRMGLALGPSIPLILQGDARIQTWSDSSLPELDDDFLFRLGLVYQGDPLFADALHDANGALKPDINMNEMDSGGRQHKDFLLSAQAASELLARADGPRVAAMELQGWDTHFGQERRLSTLLDVLAKGIVELKRGLGDAWSETAVLVVSEFGRTAAENGNQGTDHGTGGLAMLAGGAVAGGQIAGAWPGLTPSALYEGRDLHAVNAYESLFKSILNSHMGVGDSLIESRVFPNSSRLVPMDGLLKV
jgi:uncharacterized protein (DUF1501 family)